MEKIIINVGRQIGSGGHIIAEKLAEDFGCKCYDRELLNLAAKESGFSEKFFEQNDEQKGFFKSLFHTHLPFLSDNNFYHNDFSQEGLYKFQSDAIRKAADEGNCVFVGRTADYVLRDYKNVINIFITANIDDNDVREAVKKIITEKVPENDNLDVKKFLFGSIELTTLKTTDSDVSVMAFTEKVNQFDEQYPNLPHIATICVYPCFAEVVKDTLEVDGVNIACVSGSFPSSQALIEVKVAETALAIKDGADEIDIVMPVGKFLQGDYEGVCDDIQELKATCGDKAMKVILETGDIVTASNIKKASLLSMYAGADYIKTSTGKEKVSATPEAAYVMCQAIKEYYDETGIQIGFKPAGGINTVMDAITYYTIVKEVLGEKWLTNKWLRLGTSRLANLLLSEIEGKEVKFF